MSRSKSKKKLLSLLREGKLDPRMKRNIWNIKPVTKVKENKRKDCNYDRNYKLAL